MDYQGSVCFGEYQMVSSQTKYMKINVLYIYYMFALDSKLRYKHYCKTVIVEEKNEIQKSKDVLVYIMNVYMGNRAAVPVIFNLGTRWRQVVNFTA